MLHTHSECTYVVCAACARSRRGVAPPWRAGIAAHVHDSAKLLRLKEASDVVRSYGFDVEDVLHALTALRDHILLPFSPHASDHLIEWQCSPLGVGCTGRAPL